MCLDVGKSANQSSPVKRTAWMDRKIQLLLGLEIIASTTP